MHRFRQTTDELVFLDVLLLNKRFDAFTEMSLVPEVTTMIPVKISRDVTDRLVPFSRKRITFIMWTRRCARVGWIDRNSTLP